MARGTWGGALDPHIFKVTVRYLIGVQQCQNSFHLRDVGVQDNSEEDVANEVRTQLENGFRSLLKTSDSMVGYDVRTLGADTGFALAPSGTPGLNATTDDNALPSFTAAVLSLKSEIRARYGQGRMFLPLTGINQQDYNTITATFIAQANTLITAMTDHFTGDPVTHDLLLVNAHGIIPARPATATTPARAEIPPSWYDVTSLRLNQICTSLRSRKVGVGS